MPPQADWQRQPTFEAFDGPAQPKPAKRTWSWLLAHPGWAGIGGLVGIVALVLASIQFIGDTGPAPAATNMGDCSANGTNIDIDCSQIVNLPKPQSIAELGLDVTWEGYTTWYFDGPVDEIPTPPDYPSEKKNGHCADWGEYLSSDAKFFAMGPAVLLTASSGIFDQIAITNVQTNVFDHREISSSPTERSFVECKHGAGLNAGYVVNVDTRTNETVVIPGAVDPGGSKTAMPPASIVVANSYDSVLIQILGNPDNLYEGQIEVTATVNGKERIVRLGSPATPIRWVGRDQNSDPPPTPSDDVVDWDLDTRSWVPTR